MANQFTKKNVQPGTEPGLPAGVLAVDPTPGVAPVLDIPAPVNPTSPGQATPGVSTKGAYEVRIIEHPALPKSDKAKDTIYLAFVGLFSECWAFVEALDSVKPGQSVGSLSMERITAPYLITVGRADGKGASFKITNKGGQRKSEVLFV